MNATPAIAWPDGAHSAVALAFDVDGPTGGAMLSGSLWSAPVKFMAGAYGPQRALPRILDLLAEFDVPATFFVPAWVVEQWPGVCSRIIEDGHEVAHHGYQHERFYDLSVDEQVAVIRRSQSIFTRYLGITARGFRTPTGDWHRQTPRILIDEGITYSSSLRDDDRPYRHVVDGTLTQLIEIPARVDLDDYAYLAYSRYPDYPEGGDRIADYDMVLDNYRHEAEGHHVAGSCLTTTFHPQVSGTPGRIRMLRALLESLTSRTDTWFARCVDVAEFWLSSDQPQPAWMQHHA